MGWTEATLSVRGCARVALHLDGKRFDVTFVVDGILVDAILGLDFLEANGGIIDCGRKLLALPPEGLSHSLGITSSQNCAGSIQLKVGSVITIPALSEMEIIVMPKGTVSGGTWMVEGDIVRQCAVVTSASNPLPPS